MKWIFWCFLVPLYRPTGLSLLLLQKNKPFCHPNNNFNVSLESLKLVLKIGEDINNSLHLAWKYARIFVRGHYLFQEENSFPRAKLEENRELRGISEDIPQFLKPMDNKHNSLNLAAKIFSDICPWTLSVPRREQFSESEARGKLSFEGHWRTITSIKSLKDNNINHVITWQVIARAKPYNSASKRCNLCLLEKFIVIREPHRCTLNKRNELVSGCRHKKKSLQRSNWTALGELYINFKDI